MDEKIKDLLEEEIKQEIRSLSSLGPENKEKSAAIDNLVKLYKLRIEETKNDNDFVGACDKTVVCDRELELKQSQLAEQVKDRYISLGIAAAEIILPLIFYAVWMRKGFKFEENGTYTSTTFRGLFNRFKPTKK